MNKSLSIVSLIGEKAERGGFRILPEQQQLALLHNICTEKNATEFLSDSRLAEQHEGVWHSPFSMISLRTIAGDDQMSFLAQVHESENYLDRLLVSRESPGKVIDGYLILDITHLSPEQRTLALRIEQNTLMVRKHCIWKTDTWQRVDRISVLALTKESLFTTSGYPPVLDEAGQQLVEELGQLTPTRLAAMHATEWTDSHE